jgi:hypothetical protein
MVDMTIRKNPLLAALKEKGRITLGWSTKGAGPEFEWPVQFRSVTTYTNADRRPVGSTADNVWKKAKLPCRSLVNKQNISKFETLINGSGSDSLARIVDAMYPIQTKSIMDTIAQDIMTNDGDSATSDYSERIHGFPSCMANTGSVVNDNSSSKGLVLDPNDQYAGIYTNLAYYGGDWTESTGAEWPTGNGSYEYKFWAPMIWDVGNTYLSSETTHDWEHQWKYAFLNDSTYLFSQYAKTRDCWIVSPDAMRQIKGSLEADSSIYIQRGASESTLVKLGFNTLTYEGGDIITDPWLTTAYWYGYGVCFDELELRSLQSQLIMKEDDRDITTQTDVVAADAYLNLRITSPAYLSGFYDIP